MGDTVKIPRPIPCDICRDGTHAVVDGRTRRGPWAYLCERHWTAIGVGKLGTGFGQRLIVNEEAT